jgi:hypothetical protein
MAKRHLYNLRNQNRVIVIPRAYDRKKDELVRLVMLAGAAAAALFYFFSFFFSFTWGRVPAED